MSILQKRSQRAGTGILYTGGKWAIDGATQANQEAETANKVVTSDVQHFGPSACKWWGYATVSAGVPTLAASYNVTSITDTGTGQITWTIATDFSSANWAPFIAIHNPPRQQATYGSTVAAGSLLQSCVRLDTLALDDPGAWSAGGFGDQ